MSLGFYNAALRATANVLPIAALIAGVENTEFFIPDELLYLGGGAGLAYVLKRLNSGVGDFAENFENEDDSKLKKGLKRVGTSLALIGSALWLGSGLDSIVNNYSTEVKEPTVVVAEPDLEDITPAVEGGDDLESKLTSHLIIKKTLGADGSINGLEDLMRPHGINITDEEAVYLSRILYFEAGNDKKAKIGKKFDSQKVANGYQLILSVIMNRYKFDNGLAPFDDPNNEIWNFIGSHPWSGTEAGDWMNGGRFADVVRLHESEFSCVGKNPDQFQDKNLTNDGKANLFYGAGINRPDTTRMHLAYITLVRTLTGELGDNSEEAFFYSALYVPPHKAVGVKNKAALKTATLRGQEREGTRSTGGTKDVCPDQGTEDLHRCRFDAIFRYGGPTVEVNGHRGYGVRLDTVCDCYELDQWNNEGLQYTSVDGKVKKNTIK
jgi:hypothetical protein